MVDQISGHESLDDDLEGRVTSPDGSSDDEANEPTLKKMELK